jgi:hypothetical protein
MEVKMEIKKFEDLFEEIEKDLEINSVNLQEKLFKVPNLHTKYLRMFYNYQKIYLKKKKQLNELYTEIYDKYKNGDEILDKKEIQFYVLSDKEYSDLKYKVNQLENMIDILEKTVKRVNNLSFDLKHIIEWVKFQEGA